MKSHSQRNSAVSALRSPISASPGSKHRSSARNAATALPEARKSLSSQERRQPQPTKATSATHDGSVSDPNQSGATDRDHPGETVPITGATTAGMQRPAALEGDAEEDDAWSEEEEAEPGPAPKLSSAAIKLKLEGDVDIWDF